MTSCPVADSISAAGGGSYRLAESGSTDFPISNTMRVHISQKNTQLSIKTWQFHSIPQNTFKWEKKFRREAKPEYITARIGTQKRWLELVFWDAPKIAAAPQKNYFHGGKNFWWTLFLNHTTLISDNLRTSEPVLDRINQPHRMHMWWNWFITK